MLLDDGSFGHDDSRSHPYEDNECRHAKRFERRGVLTCQDCGATYNETTCEWEASHE